MEKMSNIQRYSIPVGSICYLEEDGEFVQYKDYLDLKEKLTDAYSVIDERDKEVDNLKAVAGCRDDMAAFGSSMMRVERIKPESWCPCKENYNRRADKGMPRPGAEFVYKEMENE